MTMALHRELHGEQGPDLPKRGDPKCVEGAGRLKGRRDETAYEGLLLRPVLGSDERAVLAMGAGLGAS